MSTPRILSGYLWRALRVVLGVGLLLVIVFFALARTEVGREGVREAIEARFADAFAGTLAIGELRGNLLFSLYATDVVVRDPAGQVVVRVDSVVAQPTWRALWRQTLEVRTLTLLRPTVRLVRAADGSWNAARALRRRAPQPAGDGFLRGGYLDVAVREGRVTTANRGATPAAIRDGWLFDATRTTVDSLDADVTVEWSPAGRYVDVYHLGLRLAGPGVTFEAIRGQVVADTSGWALNQVEVTTPGTALRLDARLAAPSTATPSDATPSTATLSDATPDTTPAAAARGPLDTLAGRAFDVRLAPGRLDADELTRLVPRLPLAGSLRLGVHVDGTLGDLKVREVRVERGPSRLIARGTARGWPDSLAGTLELGGSRLRAEDLEAAAPGLAWPDLRPLGLARVDRLRLDGAWHPDAPARPTGAVRPTPRFRARADLAVASGAGGLAGTARVRQASGNAVAYGLDLRFDSLDAGSLTRRDALRSRLAGTLRLDARGLRRDNLRARADLTLDATSRLGARRLDTLAVTAWADRGTARLRLDARPHEGGRLSGDATVTLGARPRYAARLDAEAFDLAAVPAAGWPASRLHARLDADGAGTTWNTLALRLSADLDTSTVQRGDSLVTLAPQRHRLHLTPPGTDGPRLHLAGDLADVTVTGDLDVAPLAALGRRWSRAARDAVRDALDKPYAARDSTREARFARGAEGGRAPDEAHGLDGSTANSPTANSPTANSPTAKGAERTQAVTDGAGPATTATRSAEAAAEAAAEGAARSVTLDAHVHLKRPDLWRALLPAWPVRQGTLDGSLHLHAGADSLRLEADVRTPRVATGRATAHGLRLRADLGARLDAPLARTLDADVRLTGDSLALRAYGLVAPDVHLTFADRRARLDARTDTRRRDGAFRLGAALALRDDRNELRLTEVYAAIGAYVWEAAGDARADLFRDAVVVPPFALESPGGAHGPQRVRVAGRLLGTATDSVAVDVENVLLYPISDLLGLGLPLGGLVDAGVRVTGRLGAPRAEGRVDVRRASLDRRRLGRVRLDAAYAHGTPTLDLAVAVREPAPADTARADAVVPGGPRTLERNRLRLAGRLGTEAPYPLNFDLRVRRADLFFFEYIFQDELTGVEGYTAGSGHIGGTLTDPLFEATMRVADGRFALPKYGLVYALDGSVRVDREGFKLRDVRVRDEDGGLAGVEGGILFNDYRYFSFDLDARLDDLAVMNVTEAGTDLPFYGPLAASGTATLKGPIYDTTLRSDELVFTPESELYLPVAGSDDAGGSGFILFADSTGRVPDLREVTRRDNLLARRPTGEPTFVDGMDLDLNLVAPEGATVHLVFDPLVGDQVNAVGSGSVQLQRTDGAFRVYGRFDVQEGDYLFSAGEVFVRRFTLDGGSLRWDGDPINAQLDLDASYRTRASRAGLPGGLDGPGRILVDVTLAITGRVEAPRVDLGLALPQQNAQGGTLVGTESITSLLNQPELATEYATSVLLTNTFLLTTASAGGNGSGRSTGDRLSSAGNQLAFNSLSQLVASQLNRYLSEALPNVDLNLGLQGEDANDLDVIYGVALRLLDDRLVIRGEGVYAASNQPDDPAARTGADGLQGEFVVEVRLSRTVSVEAFVRRTGDDLTQQQTLTQSAGAGISYETEFTTWRTLARRLFGWLLPSDDEPSDEPSGDEPEDADDDDPAVAAGE